MTDSKYLGNVAYFETLVTTQTNKKFKQEQNEEYTKFGKKHLFFGSEIYIFPFQGNIVFPIVLYGREPWSVTLREQHRLRVFWAQERQGNRGLEENTICGGP
jgi:hypothetical protein